MIGYGTYGIGKGVKDNKDLFWSHVKIIKNVYHVGYRVFDTAAGYANGINEEIIGVALEDYRDVDIITKVSPENLHYNDLIKSCKESLRRLKRDYIDVFMIHWPNPFINMKESVDALSYLKKKGLIKKIGLSNFSIDELRIFESLYGKTPDYIEDEYNITNRYVEKDIIPYCTQNDIKFIAYSPLNKGFLPKELYGNLNQIANKYSISVYQLLLIWLNIEKNVTPIVYSKNIKHIRANFLIKNINVGKEDFKLIDKMSDGFVRNIAPEEVFITDNNFMNKKWYKTLDEAKINIKGLTPSPLKLAEFFVEKNNIRPIKVKKSGNGFELMEGQLRYWAYFLAFNGKKKIPAIVYDSFI